MLSLLLGTVSAGSVSFFPPLIQSWFWINSIQRSALFHMFSFFLLNFPETWSSQVRIFNLSQKFVPKLLLSYILIPKVIVSDKDKCSMKEIIFIKKTWRYCFCDITDWGTCLGQGCPHKQGYRKEHVALDVDFISFDLVLSLMKEPQG